MLSWHRYVDRIRWIAGRLGHAGEATPPDPAECSYGVGPANGNSHDVSFRFSSINRYACSFFKLIIAFLLSFLTPACLPVQGRLRILHAVGYLQITPLPGHTCEVRCRFHWVSLSIICNLPRSFMVPADAVPLLNGLRCSPVHQLQGFFSHPVTQIAPQLFSSSMHSATEEFPRAISHSLTHSLTPLASACSLLPSPPLSIPPKPLLAGLLWANLLRMK